MAKKNSSKTVTKEALTSSEPRVVTFAKWQGIDISNTPIDSEEFVLHKKSNNWTKTGQSDSKPNFLALQNNLITNSNGSVSSRYETQKIASPPPNSELTGVAICYDDYVYVSAKTDGKDTLWRIPIQENNPETNWQQIPIVDKKGTQRTLRISSIQVFIESLIVLMEVDKTNDEGNSVGEIFRGDLKTITTIGITNEKYINNPTTGIRINSVGGIHSASSDGVSRLRFIYTITNPYGSTLQSDPSNNVIILEDGSTIVQADVYTKLSVSQFDSSHYLVLSGSLAGHIDTNENIGVDIYMTMNESLNYNFIGHAEVNEDLSWSYNWLGTSMDNTQLSMSSLVVPTINTTDGVDATHMDQYDGRLYFYGGSKPYRLYIGGKPGFELSVATGYGGAYIDIEQGSGQQIRKVLKFKTYNGATIITLLTYHHNTNKSARFNIVEDSIQITNEYATSGFHAEKVDSVIGTSSFYGADTFLDGLYACSRYGIYATTNTMESRKDIRMSYISGAIDPVFTSLYGNQISGARLLCIKDCVYFLLSQNFNYLDDLLFCYDTTTKAWSTRTFFHHDDVMPEVLHMFHIDSVNHNEGIGLVCNSAYGENNGGIYLLPTTGSELDMYYDLDLSLNKFKPKPGYPNAESFFETHELSTRIPTTDMFYVSQFVIYFDYLCCPDGLEIWFEGEDYHGRHFRVNKTIYEKYLERKYVVFMRIDRYVESLRMFIKGKAHYRLTHFNMKCFQQSSSIGISYGHDTWIQHKLQHGITTTEHHQIENYNNLKEIIMT